MTFIEELGDVTYIHLQLADGSVVIARGVRGSARGLTQARVVGDLDKAVFFDADGKRLRSADGSNA